jgi:hypothetical protein
MHDDIEQLKRQTENVIGQLDPDENVTVVVEKYGDRIETDLVGYAPVGNNIVIECYSWYQIDQFDSSQSSSEYTIGFDEGFPFRELLSVEVDRSVMMVGGE